MTLDKKKENQENYKKMMTKGKHKKNIKSESSIVSMDMSKIHSEGNMSDQYINKDEFKQLLDDERGYSDIW